MKVGIKYCGGCNPTYDRGERIKRLKIELTDQITFETADINIIYDAILVVGGCRRCCADYHNLRSKNGCIFMLNDSDYSRVYDLLKQLAG